MLIFRLLSFFPILLFDKIVITMNYASALESVVVLYNTVLDQDFSSNDPLKVLESMFCVTDSKGMRLIFVITTDFCVVPKNIFVESILWRLKTDNSNRCLYSNFVCDKSQPRCNSCISTGVWERRLWSFRDICAL